MCILLPKPLLCCALKYGSKFRRSRTAKTDRLQPGASSAACILPMQGSAKPLWHRRRKEPLSFDFWLGRRFLQQLPSKAEQEEKKLGNHDQQIGGGGEGVISCSDGLFGRLLFGLLFGAMSVFPHSWLEVHIFKMHSHLKKGDRRKKGGESESLQRNSNIWNCKMPNGDRVLLSCNIRWFLYAVTF